MTASPTAAWVWRQVINATPWGRHPTYLIHDRDAVYGKDFGTKLAQLGIASIPTPIRAPRANAVAERLVRTVRQECLDHVVVWNERHLHTVLGEFLRYYNPDRPHRALLMEMPIPRPPTPAGAVVSRPVLGGLHHSYARAA